MGEDNSLKLKSIGFTPNIKDYEMRDICMKDIYNLLPLLPISLFNFQRIETYLKYFHLYL